MKPNFFTDLIEFTHKCLEKGKFIIVTGLQADAKGKKFGKILDLIQICSDIKRLHAYCKICAENKKCKKAIYSKKINRIEEPSISYNYIEKISYYHDKWLLNNEKNVIMIDCNEEFETNFINQDIMINKIKEKVITFIKRN